MGLCYRYTKGPTLSFFSSKTRRKTTPKRLQVRESNPGHAVFSAYANITPTTLRCCDPLLKTLTGSVASTSTCFRRMNRQSTLPPKDRNQKAETGLPFRDLSVTPNPAPGLPRAFFIIQKVGQSALLRQSVQNTVCLSSVTQPMRVSHQSFTRLS